MFIQNFLRWIVEAIRANETVRYIGRVDLMIRMQEEIQATRRHTEALMRHTAAITEENAALEMRLAALRNRD